jgi:hypothetical protein
VAEMSDDLYLDGYVIVPPLSPWDEKNKDMIIPDMSYRSFDKTAPKAWSNHTGIAITDIEFSKRIQAWYDHGYRVKKAKLTIEYENK